MELWITWWSLVSTLRPCFSRRKTFIWFLVLEICFITRRDLVGVSSFIRCLGLEQIYYDRLLDFFHSSAIKTELISRTWIQTIVRTGLAYMVNGRLVLLADGVKAPKEGKKMPAVKSLHQDSASNSKPEYIMGHSFQAISLLTSFAGYFFATPLIAQIHEGLVESNRSQKTLLDKLIKMFFTLSIRTPCYFVVDAYYASKKIVLPMLTAGHHVISRAKSNAVAYLPVTTKLKKRGRPKLYGKKISLKSILTDTSKMEQVCAQLYEDSNATFLMRSLDLVWRPVGKMVRFVFVVHPTKGSAIFMSTDLNITALEIITLYSLRFKIEVSFKQAIRNVGTFAYHFWMKNMDKIRRGHGDQYLHRKSKEYRKSVQRKISAYQNFVQLGLVAQGALQIISMTKQEFVWKSFGSWLRTIRPNILPSENVVMEALRQTTPEFLKGKTTGLNLEKFILDRIDLRRTEGQRLIA